MNVATLAHIVKITLWVVTSLFFILVAYYWKTAKWWKTSVGRYIQIDNMYFFIVFLFASAYSAHMPLTASLWIAIVIYIGAGSLALSRLVLIARAQLSFPEEKEKVDDPS